MPIEGVQIENCLGLKPKLLIVNLNPILITMSRKKTRGSKMLCVRTPQANLILHSSMHTFKHMIQISENFCKLMAPTKYHPPLVYQSYLSTQRGPKQTQFDVSLSQIQVLNEKSRGEQ